MDSFWTGFEKQALTRKYVQVTHGVRDWLASPINRMLSPAKAKKWEEQLKRVNNKARSKAEDSLGERYYKEKGILPINPS